MAYHFIQYPLITYLNYNKAISLKKTNMSHTWDYVDFEYKCIAFVLYNLLS